MKTKTALLLFAITFLFIAASHSPASMEKLMKQMMSYIKKEKQQIENNQPMLPFPTDIKEVSKAKIHKGKKISEKHQLYMDDFFKELKVYEAATDSAARRTSFNTMVNSCVNCHQYECPGPVQVIEKQLLK